MTRPRGTARHDAVLRLHTCVCLPNQLAAPEQGAGSAGGEWVLCETDSAAQLQTALGCPVSCPTMLVRHMGLQHALFACSSASSLCTPVGPVGAAAGLAELSVPADRRRHL